MGTYLVTGVAGFIGSKTAEKLLERGDAVVGIDNLNDYYDVALKESRVEALRRFRGVHLQEDGHRGSRELEALGSNTASTRSSTWRHVPGYATAWITHSSI